MWRRCFSPGLRSRNSPCRSPRFTSVPDYPTLPDGMNFGEVPGVAVNASGHVFVFSRSNSANGPAFGAAAAQLFEFDQNGKFVREIGKGLYAWSEAHSVRIDRNDNIWAIDKGSNMVVRFNPQGRVVWVFGRKQEAADGAEPLGHPDPPLPPVDGNFRQPTDVAWDSQGNTYVTDGYINSRVAKYDKNGDWVKSWGTKGTGPGQFDIPHSIAIDRETTSTSAIARTIASRCSTPTATSSACSRSMCHPIPRPAPSTVRYPPANAQAGDRRTQFALHHARAHPGALRRGIHVPWTNLQGCARRHGAGGDRSLGTKPRTVLRRARARVPDGA